MNELVVIEDTKRVDVAVYYILPDGTHLGFYDYQPPYDGAIIVPAPDVSDQVWDFQTQTWGPSLFLATQIEQQWVAAEMDVIAEQLLRLEDDDPSALPGTEREWRDHRIKLRAWKEGNPDFPDQAKRPNRPS